MGLSAPLNSVL